MLRLFFLAVALAVFGLAVAKAEEAPKAQSPQESAQDTELQTAYHKLKLFCFDKIFPGQLAIIRSTPTNLTLIHISEVGAEVSLLMISLSSPPHMTVKTIGTLSGVFTDAGGKVNGVFVRRDGSVLVSYTTVDYKKCASMKLDEIVFDASFKAFWQKPLYETHPCTLPPYGLHQAGGRIGENSEGDILLTVGDFQRDDKVLSDDTDFGKILKISSGRANELARGFRNPQGLFFDPESNQLYSTDHGPEGGDEINVVEAGKNYGWPLETYGFDYSQNVEYEPFSNHGLVTYGRHDRYTKPLFAFIPDIGIGQIAKMPAGSFEFPNWLGDFFVSGMAVESLDRIKIEQGRVIYDERIKVSRIRDFVITPEGIIVASSNRGLLIFRRAAENRG
jgi:glucose/arabinose dehydrogenase